MSSSETPGHTRREAGPTAPVTTSPGMKLLLVVLGLGVALIGGEVAVRVLDLGPDLNVVYKRNYRLSDNPVLQYELVPGSPDGRFRISEAGLRAREVAREKPPGTFRILLVGDSIIYGFGVPRDETLAAHLERLLAAQAAASGPRFEVLNLGVTGYNIRQVVENLRVRGLSFQPDLVVYGFCLNDPMAYSFELESLKAQLSEAEATYRKDALERGEDLASRLRIVTLAKYAWLALRSRSAGEADLEDRQWTSIREGSYGEFFRQAFTDTAGSRRLAEGLGALQRISRESGVPVVSAVFPIFFDLDAYRLTALHERVASAMARHDIRAYDLLSLYEDMYEAHGNAFVFNPLHPNGVGHRAAALYLARRLRADGLIPPGNGAAEPQSPEDRALLPIVERAMQRSAPPDPAASP